MLLKYMPYGTEYIDEDREMCTNRNSVYYTDILKA